MSARKVVYHRGKMADMPSTVGNRHAERIIDAMLDGGEAFSVVTIDEDGDGLVARVWHGMTRRFER